MLRFASLASGSGGNCLVADADGTCVLIDCGLNLRDTEKRLARLGLEPSDINGVLVTHEHGDHAHGVFDFAAAHNVTVYLTYGTMHAMKAEGKVIEGVRLVFINGRQSEAVGGMQVMPFTVPHDAREPLQLTCTDGASRLGVLTDLGRSSGHVLEQLAGCATLLLECNHDPVMLETGSYPWPLKRRISGGWGHLANEAAAAIAQALRPSGLAKVVAAHLSEQNNRPELARAALAGAMGCEPHEIAVADGAHGCEWMDA